MGTIKRGFFYAVGVLSALSLFAAGAFVIFGAVLKSVLL